SGPVTQQIAQGDITIGEWVGQPEEGDVLADVVIPADLAVVVELGQGGGGDSLGQRADAEEGIRRDDIRLAELLDAVTLQQQDVISLDDGDGTARHLPDFLSLADEII